MRIAHFNTFPYGGAANAASRIHHPLVSTGVDSQFYFGLNDKQVATDATSHQVSFPDPRPGFLGTAISGKIQRRRQRRIHRLYDRHLADRSIDGETFSMAELSEPTRLDWASLNADVAHLHWISFFADYPTFFNSIPASIPLVWTLHDMNAFTGGCHYAGGCQRFESGCGHCPQVLHGDKTDVSRSSFRAKRKSLKNRQCHVVAPCHWLLDQARLSPVWPRSTTFQVIHYGLDLDRWKPLDKQMAREKLGIESDAILVGFGAEDIHNHRKGFQHLLGALRTTQSHSDHPSKIEGLFFGSGTIDQDSTLPAMHHLGYVNQPERLQLIYSAADIFVVSSLEDNQPQTGLEAMACGTPVVGFRAGGIPEYVRDGTTGMTAPIGDEIQLARCMQQLADNRELRIQMGLNARRMMEEEFEFSRQTQRYIQLYQTLLRGGRRRAA